MGSRRESGYKYSDCHFHLTNYIQEGPTSATTSR